MLRIVGKREGNETFFGDLFQPDPTRSRQWMRRMQGHANGQMQQFFEY